MNRLPEIGRSIGEWLESDGLPILFALVVFVVCNSVAKAVLG